MTNRHSIRYSKLSIGLAFALAAAPIFAQSTSSGVGGTISASSGQPVSGAEVTITHIETGAVSRATTDASGRYSARGLRVGGPYTITITKDGQTTTREGVYLQLDEVSLVNAQIGQTTNTLDAVKVVGQVESGISEVFSANNMGAGTNVTIETIEQQPNTSRSLADYIKLDPRVTKIDRETQQITVSGQNPRYNNIKIDGVPTNDQFGLNDSGLPSLNQPITADWIQEFNIGISSFDVGQSDFVGANVNAVTKSGTNDFKGTVYGAFRTNNLIRGNENGTDYGGFSREWTAGAYAGGPFIKDRFFYFVGYERFEREDTLPPRGILGSSASNVLNVSQGQINDLLASYSRLFGAATNPGGAPQPFTNVDEKWFLKMDFNINDDHRLAFRYNKTDGQVARFSRTTGQIQLESNVYSDNIEFESFAINSYNNWTDNLSSEFHISRAEYTSDPVSSFRLPQIFINNIPTAGPAGPGVTSASSIVLGTERSRQANFLNTETLTSALTFNYFLGDHELKFGLDYERNDVYNLFLQDVFGNYTISYANFVNPALTAATLPYSGYSVQRPVPPLGLDGIAAQFDVSTIGLMLQDTWSVNSNLTLNIGFRADRNGVNGVPAFNQDFLRDFAIDNRNVIDGNTTVQPRFGFNYTFDTEQRSQLRGGVGLFMGSAPGVWISNSFSNPGFGVESYNIAGGTGVVVNPDAPFIPPGVPGRSRVVNALSADFEQPTVLKYNLAYETELGFINDWVFGADLLITKADKAVFFENVSLGAVAGALPDGRESYWLSVNPAAWSANPSSPSSALTRNRTNCLLFNRSLPFNSATNPCLYNNAIVLRNTDKGYASNFTVSLEKPWKNNWTAKLAYTYGTAEEVSPATSSVAFSNWNGRFVTNPNEQTLSRGNYEIRDRFTASASYRFNFWENAPTTISMFYEGRSGRPFSYAFENDANGDGVSNDLFYIPNNPSNVAFTSASTPFDIAAFWQYIEGNDYLRTNRGRVAERNGDRAPFVNQFDLRISQKLPFFGDRQSEVYLDIQNFGNLLNKKWGRIEEAGFPSRIQMARFAGVNAAGQYVYDVRNYVTESALGNSTSLPSLELRDVVAESRWSVQAGFKINF